MVLKTPRLILRRFIPEDSQNMYDLNDDWEVLKYTGEEQFENPEAAREFLIAYQTNTYEKWGYGRFSTIIKESGEFIGWCGLKYHPEEDEVDLGFRFHRKYWGLGYATEASLECLEYGKNTLGLTRVIANAMPPNIGSIRVLEKCGFKYLRDHRYDGKDWLQFEKFLTV